MGHAAGALGLHDGVEAGEAAAAVLIAHLVDVVDQQQRDHRPARGRGLRLRLAAGDNGEARTKAGGQRVTTEIGLMGISLCGADHAAGGVTLASRQLRPRSTIRPPAHLVAVETVEEGMAERLVVRASGRATRARTLRSTMGPSVTVPMVVAASQRGAVGGLDWNGEGEGRRIDAGAAGIAGRSAPGLRRRYRPAWARRGSHWGDAGDKGGAAAARHSDFATPVTPSCPCRG